jgi:hypothetical protein
MAATCRWKNRTGMHRNLRVWATTGPAGYCEVWKHDGGPFKKHPDQVWTLSCDGGYDRANQQGLYLLKSGTGAQMKKLGCDYVQGNHPKSRK